MAWRNDVGDYLMSCHQKIRREHHAVWLRARKADSVQSAHRILKRALPYERIPEPWVSRETSQHKFLSTTSQYSKDSTDPRSFDARDVQPTGRVDTFSPDAYKPVRRRRRMEYTISLPVTEYLGLPFNARPTSELEG